MTIVKARQILGEYGYKFDDNQIMAIIESFSLLIEVGFQQFEKGYKNKEMRACNVSKSIT